MKNLVMKYAKIWYTADIQEVRRKALDIATEIWKDKRKELWSEIKTALQSAISPKNWKERQQLIRATFWDWHYLNIGAVPGCILFLDLADVVPVFDGYYWYIYKKEKQTLDFWVWPLPGLPISIDRPVDYIINEKYKNPHWSEYKTVDVKTSKSFGSYESK